MKLCLHIHSEYSHDSDTQVRNIVDTAKNLGYNVIAITDHNTAKGGVEALKYQDNEISIISGAEFSTQYGHVLAYFIDESIEKNTPKVDNKRFDFYKIVENVRKSNGVLILAHPYNSKLKDNIDILNYVDGIERYNSRLDSFYYKKKSSNFINTLLNKDNFIYLGGPDAHSLGELKNCYTITEDFKLNPKDFKNALIRKSIICYKKSSNYIIAKTKLHNLKKLKLKTIIKNIIRMIFGIYEILYNKLTRSKEYETIRTSKKG